MTPPPSVSTRKQHEGDTPPLITEVPLAARIISSPSEFGQQLARSQATVWQYWPAPVLAGLLGGLAYALVMRHGLNWATEEAVRLGQPRVPLPTVISHIINGFGSFFLTALTFLSMWGLGNLGAGRTAQAKVPQIYSASFTLLIPLYLACVLVTLLTPASAWAFTAPVGTTDALGLQRAALGQTAHTLAAQLLVLVSFLGTLGQFVLAYFSFRQTLEKRAVPATLLPVLPALLIQFFSVGALVLGR